MLLRRRNILFVLFTGITLSVAWPQAQDFSVYAEHPRLFLRGRRLRLLQRESQRQSIRWQQFQLMVAGEEPMPEPGFALPLFAQASGNQTYCKRAVEWALGPATDLRQLALVYDWCQAALSPAQAKSLEAKLKQGIERASAAKTIPAVRDRVLAAIALGDRVPDISEKQLRWAVQRWWRGEMVPALTKGEDLALREDTYALFEILHAVRDNLFIDLRDPVPGYFKDMPTYRLLSYYPAVYPAAENDYRIPIMKGGGRPDLKRAVLSRAADFAIVAYDPNSQQDQFLQGWLIHDLFLMRGRLGIPYEFLWANPYLPGLSYYHMPLAFHDEVFGRLFLRSSWEDDATWLGYSDGELQIFENGEIKVVKQQSSPTRIRVGDALVVFDRDVRRFTVEDPEAKIVFVVGLKPEQNYEIEVDDEEMYEDKADRGGILTLASVWRPGAGVRIREARQESKTVSAR